MQWLPNLVREDVVGIGPGGAGDEALLALLAHTFELGGSTSSLRARTTH